MYNYNFQKSFKKQRNIGEWITYYFHKIPFIGNINFTKEMQLISLFCVMFGIILIRLFFLQIIQHNKYSTELMKQSTSLAEVKAERGDIYALDKTGQPVKLTENINLYDIALDPREIGVDGYGNSMKPRLIELLTPIVYKHLCVIHGMDKVDTEGCIKNLEAFTNIELLPKLPEFFYFGKEYDAEGNEVQIFSPEYNNFDFETYNEKKQKVINEFSKDYAMQLISEKLDEKIKIGIREKNYVGYYTNEEFLEDLKNQNFNFISIEANFYIYVIPTKSTSSRDRLLFQTFMNKRGEKLSSSTIDALFSQQTYKYIKLFSAANPQIAQDIKELKNTYANEKYLLPDGRPYNKYSIVHGIILESYPTRYYPHGELLSNVVGYVDKNGEAFYGIEKYYDEILKGVDGEIKGRSSWNMGGNDFEVINTKDGDDIVLTIDIGIQKEVDSIAKKYLETFKSDSIAVMVFDPNKGEVKASVSLPGYNPNNYNDAYTIVPLGPELSYIIDNETYTDVPIYIYTGGKYQKATSDQRVDTTLKKYIAKNIYGAQVFVDKNIATAFEPGSVFKAFTMGIGLDSDEVRLDDYYQDDGSLKIDIYTIKDADQNKCMGYHTLLDALINSCNVGMIRIVQSLGKDVFYSYLTKLGFGEITGIELAEEKSGTLPTTAVSMAAFFNHSFGQGLSVTQIQLASAYAALVNGGKYIKPTIISQIRKKEANSDNFSIQIPKAKSIKQIFRPEVSEEMRNALYSVVQTNDEYKYAKVANYRLGAKSGTSQIAYKGKYQRGEGWTQATFAGVVSIDNPQYIVLIWVSRPRTNQWGVSTAGKIFNEIATFLIGYSMIE